MLDTLNILDLGMSVAVPILSPWPPLQLDPVASWEGGEQSELEGPISARGWVRPLGPAGPS